MHALETWSFCLLAVNIVKNMGNSLPLQWMVSDTQQAKVFPHPEQMKQSWRNISSEYMKF